MIDLRPQILQNLAIARAAWYGSGKFKGKDRQIATHAVHESSTMLYLLEQQFESTFDKSFNLVPEESMTESQKIRRRLQLIRNELERLVGDYQGYENKWYEHKSLLEHPGTRTDKIVKMVMEGAFIE